MRTYIPTSVVLARAPNGPAMDMGFLGARHSYFVCLLVLMGRLSRPENEIEIHSSAPIVRLSIIFLCLFHEKPSKATVRRRQKKYVNVDFNNFCLYIYIF